MNIGRVILSELRLVLFLKLLGGPLGFDHVDLLSV